jgi:hypothetical protein
MKTTIKLVLLLCVICCISSVTNAQSSDKALVGKWTFDDAANPLKAEANLGNALTLSGTQTIIDGPAAGNKAIRRTKGNYYKMVSGIKPKTGEKYVNEYTIQFDFRIQDIGAWRCFFQTNPANSDDGDCFINTTGNVGVGSTGYSSYAVKPNEWYRLVISVKNGTQYEYYLDGQLLNSGGAQAVDDRFSLEPTTLIFADNDGEDGTIDCAEIDLWNYALSADEAKALGGYGHAIPAINGQLLLVPYLQEPAPTYMYVSWHDTSSAFTRVDYGLTTSLGQSATGTNETVAASYRWHTVKLSDLQANTEYYYKAVSGSGESKIYSFRTLPAPGFTGKLRFLILGDTHCPDTSVPIKVLSEAKKKIEQLYGKDIQNQINAVLHTGDIVVSGGAISNYTDQFFAPMQYLSPYIPTMITIGNHEGENPIFYKYMHYDEASAYPAPSDLNEKFWSFRAANTLVIGMNTNIIPEAGTTQSQWLEKKLKEAQNDPSIDFVFCMNHHLPVSELWVDGITNDIATNYINQTIFPIMKKYSKVQQLSYGHTHGFERGSIESESADQAGDFRIVCGGGSGGALDRWGGNNKDFQQVQIAYDHHCFQIVEIDIANKIYSSSMYSLGNENYPLNTVKLDSWYHKVNQAAPSTPVSYAPVTSGGKITFNTSKMEGPDSLMTTRIQISDDSGFSKITLDTMVHWTDIYNVDANYKPIDRNKGINLTALSFDQSKFTTGKALYYRVRYRDHNLKWSGWSNATKFNTVNDVKNENTTPSKSYLEQNYPNPFNPSTKINFSLEKDNYITLDVYNLLGQNVAGLIKGERKAGQYNVDFNASGLPGGVYFYTLKGEGINYSRKMLLLK